VRLLATWLVRLLATCIVKQVCRLCDPFVVGYIRHHFHAWCWSLKKESKGQRPCQRHLVHTVFVAVAAAAAVVVENVRRGTTLGYFAVIQNPEYRCRVEHNVVVV